MKKLTISLFLFYQICCTIAQPSDSLNLFSIKESEFYIHYSPWKFAEEMIDERNIRPLNKKINITLIMHDNRISKYVTDCELYLGLQLIITDSIGNSMWRNFTYGMSAKHTKKRPMPKQRRNIENPFEICYPCKIQRNRDELSITFWLRKKIKNIYKCHKSEVYGFNLSKGQYYIQVAFGINSAIEGFGDSGKINQKQPEYIFITEKVPLYVK